MDRVHYRRVMPSRMQTGAATGRGSLAHGEENNPTGIETIILQSIVSGILLVMVLLISMLNIGPTEALRDGLRNALTGAVTPSEFVYDVRHFGGEILGWGPTPETDILPPELPPEIPPAPPPLVSDNINYPLTAYITGSNPQIPGPSATPGLWD